VGQAIDESAQHQWYVVYCKPLQEQKAGAALQTELGLKVFFPQLCSRLGTRQQHTPLFPRYLFVEANLHAVAPSAINATRGVVGLLAIDQIPQAVPPVVIERLRRQVDDLNARGGTLGHDLQSGQVVRVQSGPLRGLEAIFVGPLLPSQRVHVLIEFLGQLRETELDIFALEGVAAAGRPCARRTRGKGRQIHQRRDMERLEQLGRP
jgi:transcriptional antiterminator RfaH